MMFTCCCGIGALPALLNQKKEVIQDCWHFANSGIQNVRGEYKIPKTGYYTVSLSSYGADVHQAQNMKAGTAFYIGKFQKNDVIDYVLGNYAQYNNHSSQAKFGSTILNTWSDGDGQQYPSIMIRWIGSDLDLLPAKLVTVDELRQRETGIFARCNVFSDGTDVFALNQNQIFVPSDYDWFAMTENTAHYYIQNVELDVGEHTFYILGDDVHRVAINGKAVVWSDVFARQHDSTCDDKRGVGTFRVDVAGVYQIFVMQINIPDKTPSWSALSIKKPDGNYVDLIKNWKYIKNTYDCANRFIVPTGDKPIIQNNPTTHTNSSSTFTPSTTTAQPNQPVRPVRPVRPNMVINIYDGWESRRIERNPIRDTTTTG